MPPLNVFIGFDRNEIVAYHALCQSILERSSAPLRFTPINIDNLRGIYTRERNSISSTDFSFSRFLTPYLSGYEGWSLFMDCDMLALADFAELFALADDRYAVMVAKHDYTPRTEIKFGGHVQTKYQKKNWSSVMLFNNARCRALNPEFVNTASGLELHQFKWLASDDEIGALDPAWNWLVDIDPRPENLGIAHMTLGGGWLPGWQGGSFDTEWRAARDMK